MTPTKMTQSFNMTSEYFKQGTRIFWKSGSVIQGYAFLEVVKTVPIGNYGIIGSMEKYHPCNTVTTMITRTDTTDGVLGRIGVNPNGNIYLITYKEIPGGVSVQFDMTYITE